MYSSESSRKNWISGTFFNWLRSRWPRDEPVLVLERLHQLGAPVEGKDADVNLGVSEIGRHAHPRNRDQKPPHKGGSLLLEDLGHILLDLLGDLLLACGFHSSLFYNPYLNTSRFFVRFGRGFHVSKPSLLNR